MNSSTENSNIDKLLSTIQDAIEDFNYIASKQGLIKNGIDYFIDSCYASYSLNKRYLFGISNSIPFYRAKYGTQIVFGLNFKNDPVDYSSGVPNLRCFVCSDSVEAILKNAFYSCKHLDTIVLNNGLKIIQEYAFSTCNLSSVYVPNSVMSIGDYAFSDNEQLEYIYLPDSVVAINDSVFSGCTKLDTIFVDRGTKNKFKLLLPNNSIKVREINYATWKGNEFEEAIKKSMIVSTDYNKEDYVDKEYSDKSIWDAVTDGMYGDMPDGFDGDYDFMG